MKNRDFEIEFYSIFMSLVSLFTELLVSKKISGSRLILRSLKEALIFINLFINSSMKTSQNECKSKTQV